MLSPDSFALRRFTDLPRSAVVFDLEFTAWDGSVAHRWMRPGEFTEVVQIGAVKLDGATLAETGALEVLVRPRVNPVLSPYLEKLTGITNARVAKDGVDFADAYARFVAFASGADIYAFGRDDLIFRSTLRLYGMEDAAPLPPHHNVAPWLVEHGIDIRGFHACDVARLAGAPFEGRAHDALDDARSVAAGLRAIAERRGANFVSDTQSFG